MKSACFLVVFRKHETEIIEISSEMNLIYQAHDQYQARFSYSTYRGDRAGDGEMQLFIWKLLLVSSVFCISFVEAAEPLLEIKTAQKTVFGKKLAYDDKACWVIERNGGLEQISIASVTGFRLTNQVFRPYSAAELRTDLRREFGNDFEIKGTSRYLVASAQGRAGQYLEVFDSLYREFRQYFSVRGIEIDNPEFPMVAIVFPEHQQFVKYAAQDGLTQTEGLTGYYDRRTNRVALFDDGQVVTKKLPVSGVTDLIAAKAGESTSLQNTMIHEATHQVAYNVGLHSRTGQTPKWIVEGLATVFEHPDMRGASQTSPAMRRVNRERYLWFGNYVKSRREPGSLVDLVANEGNFSRNVLDAYSEAWALTFFLMETRGVQYTKYLQKIAARDSLRRYSALERINDFEASFDCDLEEMERDFLRYFEKL
ncbi:MAG TPA: hypothetical protein DD473_16715 [Planctomycetaceae bacterium]|nr:hypothetical protein [Planctomycetaceae bacterium]